MQRQSARKRVVSGAATELEVNILVAGSKTLKCLGDVNSLTPGTPPHDDCVKFKVRVGLGVAHDCIDRNTPASTATAVNRRQSHTRER
jgi:hypothetical protein